VFDLPNAAESRAHGGGAGTQRVAERQNDSGAKIPYVIGGTFKP